MPRKKIPLVLDLDGTLTKTDTLWELVLDIAIRQPLKLPLLFGALIRGKKHLKAFAASHGRVDWSALPLNDAVAALRNGAGQPIVLATASNEVVAKEVDRFHGPFAYVFASDEQTNLKGQAKAQKLVDHFGDEAFDYVGNDFADFPIFQHARRKYLVSRNARVVAKARQIFPDLIVLDEPTKTTTSALIRALRPHQWAKNLLIAVPALAGHAIGADVLVSLLIAFASFSLLASSVYLFNDLVDISHDRYHPSKRHRPIASGELPIPTAVLSSFVLTVASLALALIVLGPVFLFVLLAYGTASIAYSVLIKKIVLVDVFVLAGLYGIRLLAGAVATGISLSPWLIGFGLFAFLSLALAKRFAELFAKKDGLSKLSGRGYRPNDRPIVAALGIASGFVSAVILSLWVDEPASNALYGSPLWLWILPGAWLYWVSRVWLLAHRGALNDDPVFFALTDRVSYLVGVLIAVALLLAS